MFWFVLCLQFTLFQNCSDSFNSVVVILDGNSHHPFQGSAGVHPRAVFLSMAANLTACVGGGGAHPLQAEHTP